MRIERKKKVDIREMERYIDDSRLLAKNLQWDTNL